MKVKNKISQAFSMVICCFLLVACAPAAEKQARPSEQPPGHQTIQSGRESKAVQEKIKEALKEAKAGGKDHVDVFLDEDPDQVQKGDVVDVRVRAVLEGGRVLAGADRSSMSIIAGGPARIPGLGKAVLGMKIKGKKHAVLPPEEVFGIHNQGKTSTFPSVHTIPVMMRIPAQQYQKQFTKPPVQGGLIRINPYFESKIVHVDPDQVLVKNLAKDGQIEQAPFGRTFVSVRGDTIQVYLEPEIGADFQVGKQTGVIVCAQNKSFTVDFNHPLSGKSLDLDMEVISFVKASQFNGVEIPWIEDHDLGYGTALKKKKDKVLVLYADWCQWCKKLFSRTFTDPRIKQLKDRFVWVRANSDKDTSLKELYGQQGFPMIVLTDYKGNIYEKMEGYKDADRLLQELKKLVNLKQAQADR